MQEEGEGAKNRRSTPSIYQKKPGSYLGKPRPSARETADHIGKKPTSQPATSKGAKMAQ